MPPEIRVIGVEGIPEIQPGDDLASLVMDAAQGQNTPFQAGDIIVVTQKIVSKAEGRVLSLESVEASPLAISITEGHRRDPRHTEVVLREAKRIVRMDRGVIIAETRHGFRCANAGVDASNVEGQETVALLPLDPDASAKAIMTRVQEILGAEIGVIISDTFGRPWREGAANVAIGVAGLNPLLDYRGQVDPFGYPLRTTTIAVADELAAAAELVTNKLTRVPVAIIRGYPFQAGESGMAPLIRDASRDLFR